MEKSKYNYSFKLIKYKFSELKFSIKEAHNKVILIINIF